MDIVYASNDLYARHLAVSMISLFDRNQQAEEITVYVLSVGITEESRQKLQKIADQYHRNLELLDLTDIRDRFDYEIDSDLGNVEFDGVSMENFVICNKASGKMKLDSSMGNIEIYFEQD